MKIFPTRCRETQAKLVDYLKNNPHEIQAAADYCNVGVIAVKRWLKNNSCTLGITTLLQEGFLRKVGAMPPLRLSKPPTIVEVIDKAFAEKALTMDLLCKACQCKPQSVLSWLFDRNKPFGGFTSLRLEWFLQEKGLRPSSLFANMTQDVRALAMAVCTDQVSEKEIVKEFTEHRLLDWFKGSRPSNENTMMIRRFLSDRPAITKTTLQPEASEKPRKTIRPRPHKVTAPASVPSDPYAKEIASIFAGIAASIAEKSPEFKQILISALIDNSTLEDEIINKVTILEALLTSFLMSLKPSQAKEKIEALRQRNGGVFFTLFNSLYIVTNPEAHPSWRNERR